jgi:hypothetical protein
MRSAIAVVSSVAMLVAQMPAAPAFAQTATSPAAVPASLNPEHARAQGRMFAEAFMAFPNGGGPLSDRIADIILKNPNSAAALVRYMQTTPRLSRNQKLAAEHGLAAALQRMGIKAADMPVKAPLPQEEGYNYSYLLALLAIAGIICLGVCRHNHEVTPVSPN